VGVGSRKICIVKLGMREIGRGVAVKQSGEENEKIKLGI
jgi:hypothetical protein